MLVYVPCTMLKPVRIVKTQVFALYCISMYVCTFFNKLLDLFSIFLAKYQDMRGNSGQLQTAVD